MEREIARLEAAGTAVIRLEPGTESRRAMGLRAMAEDRSPRVIEAAYEETRRRSSPRPFLASLGGPHPPPPPAEPAPRGGPPGGRFGRQRLEGRVR